MKSQAALLRYFLKYEKIRWKVKEAGFANIPEQISNLRLEGSETGGQAIEAGRKAPVALEAAAAKQYWAVIRVMVCERVTGFERRDRKGAWDPFNRLLNDGYGILYPRIHYAGPLPG